MSIFFSDDTRIRTSEGQGYKQTKPQCHSSSGIYQYYFFMCNYYCILAKHRCTTQLAKLSSTIQSFVLTADVFQFLYKIYIDFFKRIFPLTPGFNQRKPGL